MLAFFEARELGLFRVLVYVGTRVLGFRVLGYQGLGCMVGSGLRA